MSSKYTLGGHKLILGQPWLTTVDACIAFHLGKVTISDEIHTKKLTLYSPTKPKVELDQFVWPNLGNASLKENLVQILMVIKRKLI